MTTLRTAPSLGPLLARGALLSPFKRPRPDAAFDGEPLVLSGLRIDVDRLARYERICGFTPGGDGLPLTYPHVLGFPSAMALMSRRAFPLPLLGLVHTSIGITRHRALPTTGTYELTVRVDHLAPHRRGTQASVVTELRETGESAAVWESTSTYLARHRTTTATTDAPREPDPLPAPLPVLGEWRLGGDVGRRYGAVSGDRNPIHLHPLAARLFGFPRTVAHGMWTVARCLAAHGTPPAVRAHADFRAPVLLPGTVVHAADGDRFELRRPGADGRIHVSGRVEAPG
ncbi:MaoC/PaaZ C-terminal domain-containing protein [Streptomyces antibioticus]|uniref:MaoC/PaaZ C-terminal domain-containing protein n=1 Tax=Streptomyces antibioticus TaxID=1890 RepID=UPI003D7430EC